MTKRIFVLLAVCLLAAAWAVPALGEDCFTIDVDVLDLDRLSSDDYVARQLSASTQGVRVVKYISASSELAASVRLTLTQMDSGAIVFDKNFGFQSGTFDSGVIYLSYVDDRSIPYLVTLYVGDYVYAMPFMHLQSHAGWQENFGSNGGWSDGWSEGSGWDDGWGGSGGGWSDGGW